MTYNEIIDNTEKYLNGIADIEGNELFVDGKLDFKIEEQVEMPRKPKAAQSGTQGSTARRPATQDRPQAQKQVDSSQLSKPDPKWKESTTLKELYGCISECKACPLGLTRNKFVFGAGNPEADVVVIGEAPGADEDAQGIPFVGRAGQLLTKILEAIKFKREDVFICNILKCRPPNNRKPLASEEDQCEPYLMKQLEIIKPKFILALGLTAADRLLRRKNTMKNIRGEVFEFHGAKMMVTYHPSALLRNPNWKAFTWEDVQKFRRLYDEYKQENG